MRVGKLLLSLGWGQKLRPTNGLPRLIKQTASSDREVIIDSQRCFDEKVIYKIP